MKKEMLEEIEIKEAKRKSRKRGGNLGSKI